MCVSVWAHNQDMRELPSAVERSANSDATSVYFKAALSIYRCFKYLIIEHMKVNWELLLKMQIKYSGIVRTIVNQ